MGVRYKRCLCYLIIVGLSLKILAIWHYHQPNLTENLLKRLTSTGEKDILHLSDEKLEKYFFWSKSHRCLLEGSDRSLKVSSKCVCIPGWFGSDCSFPSLLENEVWIKSELTRKKLTLRNQPRRVILVTLYNGSSDTLQLNLNEIGDLVDAVIIGDKSSLSKAYKDPFLSRLHRKWLKKYLDKIMYFQINKTASTLVEGFDILVNESLQSISDVRTEDLLLFVTDDQIINRDLLIFLKLYNDYPSPGNCLFKTYLYGFYWKLSNKPTSLPCLVNVIDFLNKFDSKYSKLHDNTNTTGQWNISHAGWHCQKCVPPRQIFWELSKRPASTRPKWFVDSPNKMIPFISQLIKNGQDFNEKYVGEASLEEEEEEEEEEVLPFHLYLSEFAHLLHNTNKENVNQSLIVTF